METLANGRYRLDRPLGSGGMATVYLGWDERLEVFRAIKILAPRFCTIANLRQRFLNEAKVMAQLQCPNLVMVYDVGIDGERIYIVLELMRGGSVADRIREAGPLPPRMAIGVCCAVLNALEVAHAAGVIHRDIKPQNILLDATALPRLTDFGIARALPRHCW
jgi:serine/threonine protein kinase